MEIIILNIIAPVITWLAIELLKPSVKDLRKWTSRKKRIIKKSA